MQAICNAYANTNNRVFLRNSLWKFHSDCVLLCFCRCWYSQLWSWTSNLWMDHRSTVELCEFVWIKFAFNHDIRSHATISFLFDYEHHVIDEFTVALLVWCYYFHICCLFNIDNLWITNRKQFNDWTNFQSQWHSFLWPFSRIFVFIVFIQIFYYMNKSLFFLSNLLDKSTISEWISITF